MRWESVLTAGLVVVAVAGAATHSRYLAVPLVDDAAISAAYAWVLSIGHGLRLTPSSQVIEGFSNPLWTLLLAAARPLRTSPGQLATTLGTVLTLLALPTYALWGAAARGRARVEDATVPLLMAGTTSYVYWGCSGMETGLLAFLLALSGVLVLCELRTGQGSLSGLVLGLVCLTRPEGLLYVSLAAVFWVASRARARKWPGRQEAGIALWVVGLFGGYLVFRKAYFDAWLPNTYYAKGDVDFHLKEYVVGPARLVGMLALAFSAAGGAFVVRAHGDWMGEWRFFAPIAPCWAQCFASGLSGVRDRFEDRRTVPRWIRLAILSSLATLVLACAGRQAWLARSRSASMRADPVLPSERVAELAQHLAPHLRALGLRHPRVAFPDVGGLALTLPNAEIIDTGSLADYAITRWASGWARGAANPPAGQDYLLNEVLPDFMDVHGPSGFLNGDGYRALRARYVPLSSVAPALAVPGYILVLAGLTRDQDPRCPGSRLAVQALSASELAAKVLEELHDGHPEASLALWLCAWAYQPERALPDASWRESAATEADAAGGRSLTEGNVTSATRYAALATVLSGGDPRRRHHTEDLRAQMFPRPEARSAR